MIKDEGRHNVTHPPDGNQRVGERVAEELQMKGST